jgi:SAM-dependent methyltransferase
VIKELGRVLKPGGKFYFTVPGPHFRDNQAGSLLGGDRQKYLAEMDRRLAHFNYLSPDDWREICARNGLAVVEVVGYLGKAATQRWETLSRFTGGLLHAMTLGKRRPIEIQRALKLRSLQNSVRLPGPIAKRIGQFISTDLGGEDVVDQPSCLLVVGHRVNP